MSIEAWKALDFSGSTISNDQLDSFGKLLTLAQRRQFDAERRSRKAARRAQKPPRVTDREWRTSRENRALTAADNASIVARWRARR